MATSNGDRVTSTWMQGFVSKLWTKIKNTFLTKDSPAGKIFEFPYGSTDYSLEDLNNMAVHEGKIVRCVLPNSIRLTLYEIDPITLDYQIAHFTGPYVHTSSGWSSIITTLDSNRQWGDIDIVQPEPAEHHHNAVDIVNVDLSGMTTTIAAEIKSRYPAQFIRMSTNSNGDARDISDKPTGNSTWAFVAEARLVKNVSSSDYSYIVHAWTDYRRSSTETDVADHDGYVCDIRPTTTACVWERPLKPSEQTYEEVGSDTQIPVITTNKYGQIVEMHTVTVKGGGGGSDPGSTYAKLASYNTFTQTQEIKRSGSTKAQIIIRNDLRDLRIGVDANGQFYLEDYADRSYSPSSNFSFMETIGAGNDTQYLFHGQADTANKLNAAYNVGDFERPVYFENGIPRACLVGFKINEMATTGNYISFV